MAAAGVAADFLEGESLLGTGHQLFKNEFHGAARLRVGKVSKPAAKRVAKTGPPGFNRGDTLPP
jgi:hypothetical protein